MTASEKSTRLPLARRIFMISMCALCLSLLAGILFEWFRSPARCDYARWTTTTRQYVLMTFPQGVRFSTWPGPQNPPGVTFASNPYYLRNSSGAWASPLKVSWAKLGFDLKQVQFSNRPGPEPAAFELFVPFWSLSLLLLLPPAIATIRWRRNSIRARDGKCLKCGYDLRANTGRCPECGSPVSNAQAAP